MNLPIGPKSERPDGSVIRLCDGLARSRPGTSENRRLIPLGATVKISVIFPFSTL
jgi:hypothetical protein